MNEKGLKILEYDKIIGMLSEKADSAPGKKCCQELQPMTDLHQINLAQTETEDALARLFKLGSTSFGSNQDMGFALKSLEIGSTLSMSELLRMARMLDNVNRIKTYGRKEREDIPRDSLDDYFEQLTPLTQLSGEISRCILSEEEMADDASPGLKHVRRSMLLTNEKARKGLGWAIAAILSPIIVLVALLCVLGSGAVSHNISAAQLCFQDGPLPGGLPAEYQACIGQTRASFAELDEILADIQSNMEDGNSLDPIRVKAVFFSLYFGGEAPPLSQFAHCFASSEIRTRSVTEQDGDGNDIQVEQTYSVFVPIEDSRWLRRRNRRPSPGRPR